MTPSDITQDEDGSKSENSTKCENVGFSRPHHVATFLQLHWLAGVLELSPQISQFFHSKIFNFFIYTWNSKF